MADLSNDWSISFASSKDTACGDAGRLLRCCDIGVRVRDFRPFVRKKVAKNESSFTLGGAPASRHGAQREERAHEPATHGRRDR